MILLLNKKAKQEYETLQSYTAGVELMGSEVKSLRNKSGSFFGSYVKIISGQAFLLNAQITPYKYADNRTYDPKRTRRLLLKKRELEELQEATEKKGISLIPLSFELAGRNIKLKLALARGKKQFERRDELKKRAVERDIQREMKQATRIK